MGTRKTSETPPCNISRYFNVALLHFCSKGNLKNYDYCLCCKPQNVFCCHVNMVTIANKPEFWMNEYWINDVLVYSRVSIIRGKWAWSISDRQKFENGKNRKTNFVNVNTVIIHRIKRQPVLVVARPQWLCLIYFYKYAAYMSKVWLIFNTVTSDECNLLPILLTNKYLTDIFRLNWTRSTSSYTIFFSWNTKLRTQNYIDTM